MINVFINDTCTQSRTFIYELNSYCQQCTKGFMYKHALVACE